ncbi:MAG: Uncharacterised protein [Glaciecola sp. HTCC2999]|nr:MAG: Uncharacterised protein [Glaciecola sp. HTCC2999]
MKNDVESKFLLSVFDKIRQHGKAVNRQYQLEGITAYTDHDGYTLFIEDSLVNLRFGFHNKYIFEYDKEEHKVAFLKKLTYIDSTY